MPDSEPERHIHIELPQDPQRAMEMRTGVYANFANVGHSDYEFTVTFSRIEYDRELDGGLIPGVVVSRVVVASRFMRELIDALEDNYSKWATREGIKNLPEFQGEEPAEPGPDPAD